MPFKYMWYAHVHVYNYIKRVHNDLCVLVRVGVCVWVWGGWVGWYYKRAGLLCVVEGEGRRRVEGADDDVAEQGDHQQEDQRQ